MCSLLFSIVLASFTIPTGGIPSGRTLQIASASPVNVDPSLDCGVKELALEFARHLLPARAPFKEAYDALQLQNCNVSLSFGKLVPREYAPQYHRYRRGRKAGGVEIYVDASRGQDSNPGTIGQPVQTVSRAVLLSRSQTRSPLDTTIFLRRGTYYLNATVDLAAQDSHLTIAGFQDEEVVISGGRPYTFNWMSYKQEVNGRSVDIQMTNLSDQNPNNFATLFINGRRAVRARYPDGNPETMGLHTNPTGYVSSADKWLPPRASAKPYQLVIDKPQRNGTNFPQFILGMDGIVSEFDPPESFWGSINARGGGASLYTIPSGLQYKESDNFSNRTWKRPETGVVHAFHGGHWGNWIFAIKSRDDHNKQILFDYGGYQEARGSSNGAEWYVENIFEELDSPGEFFFDDQTKILYYYPNGSAPQMGIGSNLQTLVSIKGSMDDPVFNITLQNIVFAHTAPTYLEKYEVPSGGDWSIHRGGTVFVEGADGILIRNCTFDSPGGNGLFLSNYVRNTTVVDNEFKYTGDSAIAVVGRSELIDGTSGNQPRGTKVIGNYAHEIGIWGKQVSFFIQAVSCQTELVGNVYFNGPRAGINFNDGFGGGNLVQSNLAFNLVRETGDHGPFNSWDRQPYLTRVGDGSTPSLTPAQSNITQNFFINNYHSTWPIDHDDGSCYYYDTKNFLVYGGYKNYLGHTKIVQGNVYIYPDASHSFDIKQPQAFFSEPFCANSDGASTGQYASGWGEVWSNNTCIIGNPNVYEFGSCDTKNLKGLVPFTANNKFYAPNATIYISCKGQQLSLADWQALGYDIGSTVSDLVDTKTIVKWAHQVLGI